MRMSEQINELAAALCKAQAEMGAVPKESENPFFKSKYADLAACVKVATPVLTKHGLSISQLPGESENGLILETILMHTSGQWIAGALPMTPVKNDPQSIGSAITYARRYFYQSIIGGVAEEDDDGNQASIPTNGKQQHQAQPPRKQQDNGDDGGIHAPMSDAQRKKIFALAGELKIKKQNLESQIEHKLGKKMNELTKSDASGIIKTLDDMKEKSKKQATAKQEELPAEMSEGWK